MATRIRDGMLNVDLGAEHLGYLEQIVYDSRKTKTAIIRELIERVHKGQIKVRAAKPKVTKRSK